MEECGRGGRIVIMGVAGSGKSRIGAALAAALGVPFLDADTLHSAASRRRMAAGQPLSDRARSAWIGRCAAALARHRQLVLACSALRRRHRARLRAAAPDLVFLYLQGDLETIRARLAARRGHFFTDEALLRSQFAILEPPGAEEAIPIAIDRPPEAVLAACLAALAARA